MAAVPAEASIRLQSKWTSANVLYEQALSFLLRDCAGSLCLNLLYKQYGEAN